MIATPSSQPSPRRAPNRHSIRRYNRLPFLALLFHLGASLTLHAQTYPTYPNWWTAQGVVSSGSRNDYGAANIGQAKFLAVAAINEMDTDLAQFGGAGPTLDTFAAQLLSNEANIVPGLNDYAAVNIGQLKNLAKPILDRLMAIGYYGPPLGSGTTTSGTYPWLAAGHGSPNDYAAANIGQLKYLFSFNPEYSATGDSIPDWWKVLHSLGSTVTGTSYVPWSDGQVTYAQAYQNAWDPVSYDGNNKVHAIAIVSGSGQIGAPGGFLPEPLVVIVTDSNHNPLVNAPVTFTVASGGGQVQLSNTSPLTTTAQALTNINGMAQTYFQFPSVQNNTSEITATAGSGLTSSEVIFTGSSDDGSGSGGGGGGYSEPFPVPPVQTYPAIDISGGITQPISSIALDDSNNGAFVYVSGTDESGNVTDYASQTWVNGQVSGSPNDLGLYKSVPRTYGSDTWSPALQTQLFVTPDGTMYGSLLVGPKPDAEAPSNPIHNGATFGFQCSNSQLTEIIDGNNDFAAPAFDMDQGEYLPPAILDTSVLACNQGCYVAWDYFAEGDSYGAIFVINKGHQVGKWFVNEDGRYPFTPTVLSSTGSAIGSGTDGNVNYYMDNSGSLTQTDPGDRLVGVNNVGCVIGGDGDGNAIIWQQAIGHVKLQSLIPPDYQQQISSINPRLVSNADINGNINILFDAKFTDPATGGTSSNTYILSGSYASLSATTTTLAQVQLTDGESTADIQCINANGALGVINSSAPSNSNSMVTRGLSRDATAAQASNSPSPNNNPASYPAGPVRFALLNGDQNVHAIDGKDFWGNRPTTIDWGYLARDNSITDYIVSHLKPNLLGPLPLNNGYSPGASVSSILMECLIVKLSPYDTYAWNVSYRDCAVAIVHNGSGWEVISENGPGYAKVSSNDATDPRNYTTLLSPKNILYYFDVPGANLPANFNRCQQGEFAYEQTDFKYTLTVTNTSTVTKCPIHVGQVIIAKRVAMNGNPADWMVIRSTITATIIPKCTVTPAQASDIVGCAPSAVTVDTDVN